LSDILIEKQRVQIEYFNEILYLIKPRHRSSEVFVNTDVRFPRGTRLKTVFVSVCGNLQHMWQNIRFLKFFASLHERWCNMAPKWVSNFPMMSLLTNTSLGLADYYDVINIGQPLPALPGWKVG
jgi:hypothetical protein